MTSQTIRAPAATRSWDTPASAAWGCTVAVTLAAAGGLHVAAALALDEGALPTAFFWVSAAGQFGAAAWMAVCLRNGRAQPAWWTALTLVGTVGVIALYFVVHGTDLLASVAGHHHETLGAHAAHDGLVPEGHQLFGTDLHGLLGAGTVVVETFTVLATAALLPTRWRSTAANWLLASGGLLWALWLAGVIG